MIKNYQKFILVFSIIVFFVTSVTAQLPRRKTDELFLMQSPTWQNSSTSPVPVRIPGTALHINNWDTSGFLGIFTTPSNYMSNATWATVVGATHWTEGVIPSK